MSKIAILISTYNGEKYIKDQIESIINQDMEIDFDIIVRDDGSKDNTIEILNNCYKQGRIKLIKGNNLGAAKSFLWLLQNNTDYDYYAFSDQDDVWYENKLQKGIDLIANHDCPALYFSNADLVDDKLEFLGIKVHRTKPDLNLESILCVSTTAQGCTTIINKELAKIIQNKDIPSNIIMHDTYITSVCALIGGKIIYDENSTMMYRMHGNNDVGFPTKKQNGYLKMMKLRLKDMISKRKIGISEQALSIYNLYSNEMIDENKEICLKVIDSKNSIIKRMKLAFSRKLKYESISTSITYRIKILLGNN